MINQFTFMIQGRIPGSSNEHLETDVLGSLEKLQTLGTMRSIRCAVSLCWFCTSTTVVGFSLLFYPWKSTQIKNNVIYQCSWRAPDGEGQHKHQMCAGQTEVSQHWREFVERRATTASGHTHRPAQDRWAAQTEERKQTTQEVNKRKYRVSLCRRPVQER